MAHMVENHLNRPARSPIIAIFTILKSSGFLLLIVCPLFSTGNKNEKPLTRYLAWILNFGQNAA